MVTHSAQMTSWRHMALFAVMFFFVITLLAAFVAIPKISTSLEAQHAKDLQVELALEAELFTRFIDNQKNIMADLASFPNVVNAVTLSDATNPDLIDLFDNALLNGEKAQLVLQDISGKRLFDSTSGAHGGTYHASEPWFQALLTLKKTHHFTLLKQENDLLTFKISVPILYNNYAEGVLSAEITMPLASIFVTQSFNQNIAFKLIQDHTTIHATFGPIEIPHEYSLQLEESGITFIYITDDAPVRQEEAALKNMILSVLFVGFIISFLFLFALSYQSFMAETQLSAHHLFNRAYILPAFIATVGIGATLTAALIFDSFQKQQLEQSETFYAKSFVKSFKNKLQFNLSALNALTSFYDASEHISRSEFQVFAAQLLNDHPTIQALKWVPQVAHAQREAYEKSAQQDGLKNFRFTEKSSDQEVKKIIPAHTRDTYFPVYFIEPLIENESLLGFDLASSAEKLAALKQAQFSQTYAATAPVTIAQESSQQKAEPQKDIIVVSPVYHKVLKNDDNTPKLEGFSVMVLRVSDMIKNILGQDMAETNLHITDITDGRDNNTLYKSHHHAHLDEAHFYYQENVNFAGKTWQITLHPSHGVLAHAQTIIPWIIGLIGTVFSLFVALFLVQQIQRRETVEALVKERTTHLKEAQDFQELVLSNNPDFVFVKDQEFKFVMANKSFLAVYPPEIRDNVIGTTSIEKYTPEEREAFLKMDKLAFKDGYSETNETIQFPDGRSRTLYTRKIRFKDANGEPFILCLARDITEREKLIERLSSSNEDLERFAYVASHDLQEPLRMIRSFSEKLEVNLADDLAQNPRRQQYFNFIIDGAKRAQDLIRDILTYSAVERSTNIYETVDMNSLVRTIKQNMAEILAEKQAKVTYDTLPHIYGNKTQFYQILHNIINNGVKYQKPDKKPVIHIASLETATHWQFSVKDNGIGIEGRHLERIFDLLQRLHRTEYAGTGLGLAICKKAVTQHNGQIWVNSKPGKGSTFYFTIQKMTSNPYKDTTTSEPEDLQTSDKQITIDNKGE